MTKNELALTTSQIIINEELLKLGLRKNLNSILKFIDEDWCIEFSLNSIRYRIYVNPIGGYRVLMHPLKEGLLIPSSIEIPKEDLLKYIISYLHGRNIG